MVPRSAMATVMPRAFGDNPYAIVSECVVPEITAVSKPNNKPPSAPTAVALARLAFIAARSEAIVSFAFLQSIARYHRAQGPAFRGGPLFPLSLRIENAHRSIKI